jgi:hypothetical protein
MKRFRMYRINSPKVIHETIDGETVLVNLDSGNYYSLDRVGVDVWNLIESRVDQGGIIEAIARRYAGERETMERAIHHFMKELEQDALIVKDDEIGLEKGTGLGTDDDAPTEDERKPFEVPVLNKYTDMQDLLLLDPIHDVDESGWPSPKSDPTIRPK